MNDHQQPVTIRRRQPRDVPALAEVLRHVHAHDGYPVEGVSDPEAWIQPPRELAGWTALLRETPIGHISLTQGSADDDAARLWHQRSGADYGNLAIPVRLFVDPPCRALGAGRQLMLTAYQHAVYLSKQVVFDVMLKDAAAIRLYESLGCTRIGTITHHHSGHLEEAAAVYVASPAHTRKLDHAPDPRLRSGMRQRRGQPSHSRSDCPDPGSVAGRGPVGV
jgi:GNAT superfamily N-acetyltransferase